MTPTACVPPVYGDSRLPERFWSKVSPQPDAGCWLWVASTSSSGYGQFSGEQRRRRLAHRVTYETLVGPVPAGLELDHLCRVRRCCNPAHLEPVTRSENHRRGIADEVHRAQQLAKTHCPKGHQYTPENTYLKAGARSCRRCAVIANREWRARNPGWRKRVTWGTP